MMAKEPTSGAHAPNSENGPSRLELIARILKVDPSFFRACEPRFMPDQDPVRRQAFVNSPDGAKLIGAFLHIEDEQLRRELIELILRACSYKPQA